MLLLEPTETKMLLEQLVAIPALFSFLDEPIADELEARGFFCITERCVTACGRDYMSSLQ